MKLRGIYFQLVSQASGATNFFEGGYWFHWPLKLLGLLDLHGSGFVSKTSTLPPRPGNMPLRSDGTTPRELVPRCIYVDRRNLLALNAVSLSGLGLEFLLNTGKWQKRARPFKISLMSQAPTPEARLEEIQESFSMLNARKREFKTSFGVQLNGSCPNGGVDPKDLPHEALPILDMAGRQLDPNIPLEYKFGPDAHPQAVAKIAKHKRCDSIHGLNTLKFGDYPVWARKAPRVKWKELFGTNDPKQSPMAKRFPGFPGGLSGAPLRPFVIEWVRMVRAAGVTKHIEAGDGFLHERHVDEAKEAGADSVSIGSSLFLNPRQVKRMIRRAYLILNG